MPPVNFKSTSSERLNRLFINNVILLELLLLITSSAVLKCSCLGQTRRKLEEMGYNVEVHFADTKDGYKLALERIPHNKMNVAVGQPVLLLHGLFCSSYIFALNHSSLALVLSDAGFDVWLYNARDVGLSRIATYTGRSNHHHHSWKYSYHEMGTYDLPACIDYILNVTNRKNLNVLGYSLGGTITLVLLSENPEYNEKFKKTIMIAPAARFKSVKQPLDLIRFWAPVIQEFLNIFDYFPFTMKPESTLKLIKKYCSENKRTINNCRHIINFASGVNTFIEDDMILSITESFPQPFSSRTIQHYVQGIESGEFRKYNYGSETNMIKYKSEVPPLYNLTKVTAPTIIVHSLTDPVTASKDIYWLKNQLQNVMDVYSIKGIPFGHLSYSLDAKSKEIVSDYIVQKLKDD